MIKKSPIRITPILNIILVCSFFVSCHGTRKAFSSVDSSSKSNSLEFKGNVEMNQGSTATFELVNNSREPITIFAPHQKRIERFENENWRKLRILSCSCEADCNAPPESLILKSAENLQYNWNLMEGWCGKIKENSIPKTIENSSSEGLYRISVDYSIDGTNRLTIAKEFKIINI